MKALVYHGRDDLRYEDFAEPDRPGSGEVRIRIRASGLCHTDFNEIRNGPLYVSSTPHPLVTEVLRLSDARDRLMHFEELGKTGIKAQIEM